MTIAQEIRDQEMFLRDPATRWVRREPNFGENEACAVARCDDDLCGRVWLSWDAQEFVAQLLPAEDDCPAHDVADWNDCAPGVTREQVISLLEEAAYLAEEMGV